MGPLFQDRFHAGKVLAKRLQHHAEDPHLLVLGLPRGGVPVAYEVARALDASLDVFVVRKLGVPGYEELAMGAIATGSARVLNDEVIQRLHIPLSTVEASAREQEEALARDETVFRGTRPMAQFHGRTVVLVDDGLATGATMRAAVRALRLQNPSFLSVAVPVGSRDTCDQIHAEVDELVCAETPDPFFTVGTWYANFLPMRDEEVRHLLDRAAHERRAHYVQ